jgi:hypothetical protein
MLRLKGHASSGTPYNIFVGGNTLSLWIFGFIEI